MQPSTRSRILRYPEARSALAWRVGVLLLFAAILVWAISDKRVLVSIIAGLCCMWTLFKIFAIVFYLSREDYDSERDSL
jgi:hypothetical protein